MVSTRAMASVTNPRKFLETSGDTNPVWYHRDPPSNRPKFMKMDKDLETDICIIGAGVAGISTAYELVKRGREVTLIEAREVLSGETGRTSGHLSSDLDGEYAEIKKKHGEKGAKAAAASHMWAIERVGEISNELGIDCEYRKLPGYQISQYPKGSQDHDSEIQEIKDEIAVESSVGIPVEYHDGFKVKGWTGAVDQSDAAIYTNQATFHPTLYFNGVLQWLEKQPSFQCFTMTRVMSVEEKGMEFMGLGKKTVKIETEGGNTIECNHAVEATCVPLQKLSVVAQMEFMRTYCIAIRVPKGSIEDCLLYDEADAYKYTRLTECDEKYDYLIVGGMDHKVGQEDSRGRFEELEKWTRERFTQAGAVDYQWSGQVFESVDHVAFIGRNQGQKHVYVVTGDCGNGLTHGVLAGRLLADEISGVENEWASLYAPNRLASIVKSLPSLISHDIQINSQYKRFLQSDIQDIEDLPRGCGGVMNPVTSKPIAVYKDENGKVERFSALCPHLKGVVCWNATEKSWDCPIHGSRFSKDGVCIIGPSKGNLPPADEEGEEAQKSTA